MWNSAKRRIRSKVEERSRNEEEQNTFFINVTLPLHAHSLIKLVVSHHTSPRIITDASILPGDTRRQSTPGLGKGSVLGRLRATGGVLSFVKRQLVRRETISRTNKKKEVTLTWLTDLLMDDTLKCFGFTTLTNSADKLNFTDTTILVVKHFHYSTHWPKTSWGVLLEEHHVIDSQFGRGFPPFVPRL